MEWEPDEKEVKAAGAEALPDGRFGLRIHGWEIESSNRSCLSSLNLQSWEEKLQTTHLPEMIFGDSSLVLKHMRSGMKIYFNAFDALLGWKQEALPPVEVPAAAKWKFRSCSASNWHQSQNSWIISTINSYAKACFEFRQIKNKPREIRSLTKKEERKSKSILLLRRIYCQASSSPSQVDWHSWESSRPTLKIASLTHVAGQPLDVVLRHRCCLYFRLTAAIAKLGVAGRSFHRRSLHRSSPLQPTLVLDVTAEPGNRRNIFRRSRPRFSLSSVERTRTASPFSR